jgi:hypothetical protein
MAAAKLCFLVCGSAPLAATLLADLARIADPVIDKFRARRDQEKRQWTITNRKTTIAI